MGGRVRAAWALDADGYLHLADRRGNPIPSGGANVRPAEVEAAPIRAPVADDGLLTKPPFAN